MPVMVELVGGGGAAVSSLVMVAVAVPVAMRNPEDAFERTNETVSLASTTVSPRMVRVTVLVVSPAANDSVPDVAPEKSAAVAVPPDSPS